MDTAESRWNAVVSRDRSAEHSFVYGVRTTGIYCRPGCASRLARRINVLFFDNHHEAEQAGFRPCQRCRPGLLTPKALQESTLAAARRAMDSAPAQHDFKTLAAQAGLSPFHFHRLFRQTFGITPAAYARQLRMKQATRQLRETGTVTEAIYSSGFNSSARFYEQSTKKIGMTPTTYRRAGKGMTIRFCIVECTLGFLLVAATERGVCSIRLGDTSDVLEEELRREYSAADLQPASEQLAAWTRAIVQKLEDPSLITSIPLDVQGTMFQHKVWDALTRIQPGTTRTYAQLAHELDMPNATRAVARACAANPVAVVVPCHRVIGADGAMRGYRWGIERKQALLEREATQARER